MKPWRHELFEGLPTEQARQIDQMIDTKLATRIADIEPSVSQPEVKKFLEVLRSPAAPGVILITWKRIPCLKVYRRGTFIDITEWSGSAPGRGDK